MSHGIQYLHFGVDHALIGGEAEIVVGPQPHGVLAGRAPFQGMLPSTLLAQAALIVVLDPIEQKRRIDGPSFRRSSLVVLHDYGLDATILSHTCPRELKNG